MGEVLTLAMALSLGSLLQTRAWQRFATQGLPKFKKLLSWGRCPPFFMVEFVFTDNQREKAYKEGLRRQQFNEAKHFKGRNNAPTKGRRAQQMHILGAAAEMAVAVYLDLEQYLYLHEEPVRGSCDLPGIDVKCRSRHDYDLLIQLDDSTDKNFVLVTIDQRKTIIHGWIRGSEGMKEEWIKEFVPGRACYAVPQSNLHPLEELRCLAVAA